LLIMLFGILVIPSRLVPESMQPAVFLPAACLAAIIVFCVFVFQTGRLNVQALRTAVHLESSRESFGQSIRSFFQSVDVRSARSNVMTYSSLIIFVVSDASRTLSQQSALSRSTITPQSMVLACYLCGVLVAICMCIFNSQSNAERVDMLKKAFDVRKILLYLPSAFLFALASTLLCLAFANGISAALSTALGYIYMPMSALASRFILGKYYMWLEWLGLIILTFACIVFGFLQQYFASPEKVTGSSNSSVLAMLYVVLSAITSVFASLVAEKVLKAEQLPFHVQKVRLDIGSVMATLVLFPIIGAISTRPQDAFWKERPLDAQCADSRCWAAGQTHCDPQCTCECDSGVFVAWNNWLVVVALVINVVQGWLTGVVIKQFSTVLRAIAQASTILVIYFIGDPLINPNSVHNMPLTLVAFVIPLSTTVFNVAVSEMEKVTVVLNQAREERLNHAREERQAERTMEESTHQGIAETLSIRPLTPPVA